MGGGSSWPWTALAVPSSFLFNVFHMWLWTPVSDFFSKYRVTILLKQLMQSVLTCFQDLSFYFCNYWASLSVLLSHFSSNFILLFVLQCFGVSNCLVWLWSKSMLTKIAFLQQWRNSHWGLSCAPQHRAVLHVSIPSVCRTKVVMVVVARMKLPVPQFNSEQIAAVSSLCYPAVSTLCTAAF